jgi:hypothetical protein
MKIILLAVLIALLIALFTPIALSDQNRSMMMDCPMKVQGAELSATDVSDGIALTLITKEGDAAELRRRVEKMAKMLPFTAAYEEVPNGARLTLTPKDPMRIEEFRAQVRQHLERMKNGECSMMSGTMNRMMQDMIPKTNAMPDDGQPDHSTHHE